MNGSIKKTLKLILPYWKSEEKFKAWVLLFCIIFLSVGYVWLTVKLNIFTRDLYNAFEQKIYKDFLRQIYKFILLVIAVVFGVSTIEIATGFLQFSWRRWLTKKFLTRWSKDSTYYHVMLKKDRIDNPDQRISQDLKFLSFYSLELFFEIFLSVLSLVSFSAILWQISANFPLQIFGEQYRIKGYLLWIAFLYAGLGTYFAIKVGKPLINLEFINEKVEADFRFSLIRLQEKKEETALYDGTQTEMAYLRNAFFNIQQNFYSILVRSFYYRIYSAFYINLDLLIPLIAISPMYFAGAITFGIVMQTRSAFNQIMTSLAVIVQQFQKIASWRASVKRLIQFNEYIEIANQRILDNQINITKNKEQISISGLSLETPDQRRILDNINMSIGKKERVLLMGESGIGKSTIIRALAGLWVYGEGDIRIPQEDIYFVPQRPYMPISTLRDAILYPAHKLVKKISDFQIIQLLKDFKLGYLHDQLDILHDWGAALSLGEQQRISMIRILLHKPKWLVMDEPTSSLNDQLQHFAFSCLTNSLKDSAIITIGHTKELQQFHTKVIDVGQWKTAL